MTCPQVKLDPNRTQIFRNLCLERLPYNIEVFRSGSAELGSLLTAISFHFIYFYFLLDGAPQFIIDIVDNLVIIYELITYVIFF
jgi:hypothetical protein